MASHSHLVALSGHLVTTLFAARYDPSLALVHFSAPLVPVLSHSAHSPVQTEHVAVAAPAAAVFLNPVLHAVHVPGAASQVAHPEEVLFVHSTQALLDFVS